MTTEIASTRSRRPRNPARYDALVMRLRLVAALLVVAAAVCISTSACDASPQPGPPMDPQLVELGRTFTLSGKPVPPLIFVDLGDGDLADSEHAIDSIDLIAAAGSNLYSAPITNNAGWMNQHRADGSEAGYHFVGLTTNGLVAVVSRFSGGGTGVFYVLHILELHSSTGFDAEGQKRERVDLRTVRSIPLGDRWFGEVRIDGNSLVIRTAQHPGDHTQSETRRILAERP